MSEEWVETTLEEITIFIKRGRAPKYSDEGTLVINQKCIQRGNILNPALARRSDSEAKPIPEWAWVRETDTLVNSTGRGTLGRASYVGHQNEPATADSHVAIVRPDLSVVDPRFVGIVLSSRAEEIESLQSGSTSQTELSPSSLATLKIPVPPSLSSAALSTS